MGRTCTVCRHDRRHDVEVALIRREPYRHIAQRYSLSVRALTRHARDHLPEVLLKSHEAEEVADANKLKSELERVKEDVERLKSKAEEEGDYRTALMGCDKALKALELQAKLAELINESPTVNLYLSSEWLELRALIVGALELHPEARQDVLMALEKASDGQA